MENWRFTESQLKILIQNIRMARQARAALADMRALEEQAERMNPVDAKKQIRGSGATPSMGLSQFRGGARKGKMPPAAPASDSEDECECAGKMLAEHVEKMHGGAYLHKFMRGMGKALLGKEGHGVHGGAMAHSMGMHGGINTGAYEGGENVIRHVGAGMNISGPGYEEVAGGKKAKAKKAKRAPAAVSDARKKRGAMVSKLMKEYGMSLGEASAYIKEHGLGHVPSADEKLEF